jgi:hypothetical protein
MHSAQRIKILSRAGRKIVGPSRLSRESETRSKFILHQNNWNILSEFHFFLFSEEKGIRNSSCNASLCLNTLQNGSWAVTGYVSCGMYPNRLLTDLPELPRLVFAYLKVGDG